MNRIEVQIVGVTGYAGGELYRLLLGHPRVEVKSLSAKIDRAQPVSSFFPNLQGVSEQVVVPVEDSAPEGAEAVFLCTPHGVAMALAGAYLERGIKVIDFSGDHRLKDPKVFQAWYGMEHRAPERLPDAVYGLPELYRAQIRSASLIANPGCYPTSAILALAPLVRDRLIALDSVVIDSKSGVSGAGRNPNLLFHLPECGANCSAYKIAAHQHTPEIEQVLGQLAGEPMQVSFVPHVLPISRGMLTTAYADLAESAEADALRELYREFYQGEPFVRVQEGGNRVSLNTVVGSNYCDIGVFLDERLERVIAVSVIDNLIKGAAGQAVQNFNLMFGLDETLGLTQPGWLI